MDRQEKLSELSRYLEKIEQCLEREQADKTGHEHWQLAWYFPNLLRSSVFIMIYGEIETRLDEICFACQRCRRIGLKPDQLRGNGVKRAEEYLSHVCGLDLTAADGWDLLRECNHLRNLLVHNRGLAEPKDREIHKFADSCPDLSLDNSGRILLGRSFCFHILDTARQLFAALEEQLE